MVRTNFIYLILLTIDFLTDESIMEVMTLDEMPWNDYHHHSSFLPILDKIENNFSSMFSSEIVNDPK